MQLTSESPAEVSVFTRAAEPLTSASDVDGAKVLRPVDLRPSCAETELGVAAPAIERMPFDLSILDDGGVFINVDARNFGLLDRRLDWQTLGITLPRDADLAFRAPSCGL